MNSVLINLVLFIFYLCILIKSASYATIFSGRIAKAFKISEFIVSFFIVAILSALPEATIAIFSAIQGVQGLGLGTLLGSNVGDLALVFGIVTLFSRNGIRVKSEILKKDFFYLILLVIPVVLGFDGEFTRIEGFVMIFGGILFFWNLYRESNRFSKPYKQKNGHTTRNLILLILSIALLVISSHFTVKQAVLFAQDISVPPVIIGLSIIALGTCLPELFFSIRAVRTNHQGLAIGDILGTVVIDSTLVLGLMIVIAPFSFNIETFYITAFSMLLAAVLVMIFMRTGRVLSKLEGFGLVLFYIAFLIVEFIVNGL